ncbi:MAG: helix-hairpin-helix domain-containing protein [Candidatus Omnitrophica bacterium]|nr:helix-hairpin-helix domain-containing protein [Candidatus Omnitrophota bacterium]
MFNLERLERGLLIFLLGTLLVGAGIIAYKKSFSTGYLRIEPSVLLPETFSAGNVPKKHKKININEASSGELTGLKGVGPTLAARIVEYRSTKGMFLFKEDLKKVPRIGEKLFSKIKDDISVE